MLRSQRWSDRSPRPRLWPLWLLGAAVLLLVLGFRQTYRRGKQCSTRRSPVSVVLFWVAVAVVVLVTIFPQLIANWLAG